MAASHYATFVCGRANSAGDVEIANAGHCPPIVVRARGSLDILGSAGLPVGLVIGAEPSVPYSVDRVALGEGDVLVVYTDGLTEAYGTDRLFTLLERCGGVAPRELIPGGLPKNKCDRRSSATSKCMSESARDCGHQQYRALGEGAG